MLSDIRRRISGAHPEHIHHQPDKFASSVLGEVVFGAEDGMVSTLGAITGIAAVSHSHFFVVLSGLIIISVESISMAVGSYLSSKSEIELTERVLKEEKTEIKNLPDEEEAELTEMYKEDGWPVKLSKEMAKAASKRPDLFLKEMAYRELKVIPGETDESPTKNGFAMGVSYVLGGTIPIIPYFLIPWTAYAITTSIVITLFGLFVLGSYTTRYTKRVWWKAGLELFALATAAALVGFGVGQLADKFIGR